MDNYIATIIMWATNFAPSEFAFCQGQQMQVTQNAALYSLIGTMYGGNGSSFFNLPDLRGRVPVGAGQGNGTGSYTQGAMVGTPSAQLTVANMPPHVHPSGQLSVAAWNTPATSQTPANNLGLANPVTAQGPNQLPTRAYGAPSGAPVGLAPGSISGTTDVAGSGVGFSIVQPVLAIQFAICVSGIYPMRPN